MNERLQPPLQPEYVAAKHALYELTADDDFYELLRQRKVRPDADTKPPYWRAVAEQAHNRYPEQPDEDFQNALNRLTLTAPYFMFVQHALNTHDRDRLPGHLKEEFLNTVSHFNGLVRQAAALNPGMRASELRDHLSTVVSLAIPNRTVTDETPAMMQAAIRGAQHEMAFVQLVTAAGMDAYPTSIAEDRSGSDLVVDDRRGHIFHVDVKASHSELHHKGIYDKNYLVRSDGKIVMQSHVTDRELNDRFFIDDEVALQKVFAIQTAFTVLARNKKVARRSA